jgi:repressor LexA
MTSRQEMVFAFIKAYIDIKGFPPSMQDVATGLGLRSRSNMHRIIHGLVEEGLLSISKNKARTIKIKKVRG